MINNLSFLGVFEVFQFSPFSKKKGRRNGTIHQLNLDASECLEKVGRRHNRYTSSLTSYKAEEAYIVDL
jgi:hypothetical protein